MTGISRKCFHIPALTFIIPLLLAHSCPVLLAPRRGFPGKGEFFSRGLESPVSGSNDWGSDETPFFLKKGEKPDLIKLHLVVKGTGKIWVKDVELLKGPLPSGR